MIGETGKRERTMETTVIDGDKISVDTNGEREKKVQTLE